MTLPNWWQITIPHKDIVEGRFDESIFAADLGNVILGKASVEYMDGSTFFQKTYLTKGLQELLVVLLKRLSGSGKGQSVIQLQTPFGGGKTHALLGLYHLLKNGKALSRTDVIKNLIEIAGIKSIPKVKVPVFVGTHADALGGRTPWGEIAHQLGVYDIVKEHDKKRIAPGKERILEMMEKAGACLILIDELLEYVVKKDRAEKLDKITQGQTLAFLQEISEAIATTKDSAMVITLPASILEQYDERAEKALSQLQKVSGRVESIYTPVEGVEIYEVIRKRLFEDISDDKTHTEVAQWFFNLYNELGDGVPSEMRTTEYREKIIKSYPFHPELIDALYERWGSFPTFQRTRGVLRLLAEAMGDLFNKKQPSALIQSSMMPLDYPPVRREFIKHIGNEYDSIIAADIGEKGAKAPQIDRQMGSEYAKQQIATGLATSVFLYSFTGGPRKGLNLRELRVTILREGIPKTIVGDAVKKLEEELWYFHASSGVYSFRNQANLNRVIVDSEDYVSDDDIDTELRSIMKKNAGSDFETFLWPSNTSDVPDSRKIKLVILPLNMAHPGKKCDEFTEEIYTRAGSGYRVYKNGLILLTIDDNSVLNLKKHIKRLLALELVQKDESKKKTISKSDLAELSRKIKDAKLQIPFLFHSAYRYLAHLTNGGHRWIDLGMPTVGAHSSFSNRVKDFMMDEELLLRQISPKVILSHTKLGEKDEKRISDIFEMYLKTPGLPLLQNLETLCGAVRTGVKNGAFGLRTDSAAVIKETVFDVHGEMNIIGKELANELIATPKETEEPKKYPEIDGEKKPTPQVKEGEAPKDQITKSLSLSANVDWDKLSAVISGVIGPLKARDAQLQVKLNIKAVSETGFDRTTLDSRVKETLQQIGAQIELWQED